MSTDSNIPPEGPDTPDESGKPDESGTPDNAGLPEKSGKPDNAGTPDAEHDGTIIIPMPIEDEMKESYLTYAMSVIVSRALPDVRDGLKPSQRRILIAMNDLNLGPSSKRAKCARISGETSGKYHPHGETVIYPTMVRLAQDWNMRHVLVDKQGNFGSIAGLPAAAMRYTEARMSSIAGAMLEDLKLDTVDFVPNYDETLSEPTVLPSKFPNLLVNGTNGIAVGMATSIPPHNLGEICDAITATLDDPSISIDELMEYCPGPDFPTGGIICGRSGIRRGYHTGRSTLALRARCTIETKGKKNRIVINEVPYQQARDRIEEKIADLVTDGRIVGISNMRNESDLKEPVRIVLELKRDADPDVVLNQLYQFSPLQDTVSMILLALVDGKPRVMTFKDMITEFIRHRVTVIRRRTQFLLARARRRQHTVEGLLIAHANIDEVIRTIRESSTQAEAKQRLTKIEAPAAILQRALGDQAFEMFQEERGVHEFYTLTPVQADAILRMTLGQLVNLEQAKLGEEYRKLLDDILEYNAILADEKIILGMIRDDLAALKKRHANARRTEISGEEIGNVDLEDLIREETMVVSISTGGYIKRTPVSAFRSQRRGGKGLKGAKTEDADPIQHLFIASTHAYLLFFTNKGKVYWHKVYNLPQTARDARGRAIVNLLNLAEGETIADCRAVKDFDEPGLSLIMATRNGLIKKTYLKAYRRPLKSGIIAIKLREGDELIDVGVAKPGDEIMFSTSTGMTIRFKESDARAMGRNSSGVKGINLIGEDHVVGMVITDPEGQLLTICENGYGKRTPFGPNQVIDETTIDDDAVPSDVPIDANIETDDESESGDVSVGANVDEDEASDSGNASVSSTRSYRTQRRGGKGIRDIKTTKRNGPVIGAVRVAKGDEIMMMTARGKIQRIATDDVSVVGRNTQGVKIMTLDKDDTLVAVKRIPSEALEEETPPAAPAAGDATVTDVPKPDAAGDTPPAADASDASDTTEGES